MGRIITTVITIVVVAVLVAMNLGFSASVNLFGKRFDNVPVVTVAALSFALGTVYAFFISMGIFLHNRAKRGLAGRNQRLGEREKELAEKHREAAAGKEQGESPTGSKGAAVNRVSPAGKSRLTKLRSFFGVHP